MAVRYDNDCVGCERCISCGRDKQYAVHYCDKCNSEDDVFELDGEDLCYKCLVDKLVVESGATRYED